MPEKSEKKRWREEPARGGQARGHATRRSILEATLALIAKSGLGAIRFRAVAERAGVSLGVITYHFPTRQDLLRAAFALHLEQVDREGADFTDRSGAPFDTMSPGEIADAVMDLLRSFVTTGRDSFIASQELTLELTRDASLAFAVESDLSAHRVVVTRLLERAGSSEPELDADILSAAFEGLTLKWLQHGSSPDFEARLRPVVERLMSKFVPRSAEPGLQGRRR